MSTDIKSIQIAGARPKDLVMKGRRRSRKQDGGGDEAPLSTAVGQIAISKLNPDPAPVAPLVNPAPADSKAYHIIAAGQKGGNSAPSQSASSKSNIPPGPELSATTTKTITGGVILKSKKRTAKVLLKKKEAIPPAASGKPVVAPKRHATRKVVLKSLSKRLKKTRHAVKQAQVVPIEKIRTALVEKKLIKPTSKAPESVLRQIYADSIIVAKKTL
jgi:hypothetical protein